MCSTRTTKAKDWNQSVTPADIPFLANQKPKRNQECVPQSIEDDATRLRCRSRRLRTNEGDFPDPKRFRPIETNFDSADPSSNTPQNEQIEFGKNSSIDSNRISGKRNSKGNEVNDINSRVPLQSECMLLIHL